MSDAVKWALLVAGAVAIIALIVALPFVQFIDLGEFGAAIGNIVSVAGSAFRFGRGLINCFLLPFGRNLVSGIMIWLVAKWAYPITIKILTWIYHYVFK